jgi:hypothetical protein
MGRPQGSNSVADGFGPRTQTKKQISSARGAFSPTLSAGHFCIRIHPRLSVAFAQERRAGLVPADSKKIFEEITANNIARPAETRAKHLDLDLNRSVLEAIARMPFDRFSK